MTQKYVAGLSCAKAQGTNITSASLIPIIKLIFPLSKTNQNSNFSFFVLKELTKDKFFKIDLCDIHLQALTKKKMLINYLCTLSFLLCKTNFQLNDKGFAECCKFFYQEQYMTVL